MSCTCVASDPRAVDVGHTYNDITRKFFILKFIGPDAINVHVLHSVKNQSRNSIMANVVEPHPF